MHLVLASMGIGGEHGSGEALSQEVLDELAEIAEVVHTRAEWRAPCCPLDLARSEGIGMHRTDDFGAVLPNRAFYPRCATRGDEGLSIAVALAGVILVRRRRYSELRSVSLAAELLVPEWSLDVEHLWAPAWLLKVRARVLRAA